MPPETVLTGCRCVLRRFAQGGAKLDGNLSHFLQVTIFLSLQIVLLCSQLLHIGKKVPLDDFL